MQRTQRFRQAHHPLRQLRRQEFANCAGLEQLERLIGELAQGRLLNAFGSRVDRRQGLLQLRGAHIALDAVFRVDHLGAVLPAFGFTVGQHPTTSREAVFHRRVKVEKAHGEDAGAVADLAGQHPPAAEGDIAVEHFAFHGGINPGKQLGYRVKMGAIFVTQRQVQQQVLNRMQADLRQFTALRSAHTGE